MANAQQQNNSNRLRDRFLSFSRVQAMSSDTGQHNEIAIHIIELRYIVAKLSWLYTLYKQMRATYSPMLRAYTYCVAYIVEGL